MAATKKTAAKTVTVTLSKSVIGSTKEQIAVVRSLGLNKRGSSKTHNATPQILGMINKIVHLLEVVEG